VARRRRVAILNASHVEQLLGDDGSHETRASGSGDEANAHRAALARHLAGHRVGKARLAAPKASAHGHQVHLGVDDATANGRGHLLGRLDAESNVSIAIADSHVALEARALASARLLLHGHDLHHLVLQARADEVIDDLVLLDGQGEEENLLDTLDLALLDQAAKLRHGDPLILVTLVPTTATATSAVSSTATTAVSTTTSTVTTTAKASTSTLSCLGHLSNLYVCVVGKG